MPDISYSIALSLLCHLCRELLGHRVSLPDVPRFRGYVLKLSPKLMVAILTDVPQSRDGHLVHLPDLSTK